MARLNIDTGTLGNPATGDTLRTAMTKINTNFAEVYSLVRDGSSGLIATDVTNGDLKLQANGTGVIEIDTLQVNGDAITSIVTNGSVDITGNGTGGVNIEALSFNGTSISSADSSSINLNENVDIDGDLNVTGNITGAFSVSAIGDITAVGSTLSSPSNADLTIQTSGSGNVVVENLSINGDGAVVTGIKDEDNMASDSAVKLATQQSIKAYVDAEDANIASDSMTFTNKAGNISQWTNDSNYATQAYVDARDIGDLSVVGSTISAPSNADLTLTTSGTGSVSVDGIQIKGTELSSTDSTQITIKENLHVTGNITGDGSGLTGVVASSISSPASIDNITLDDNIISTSSNANLNLNPGGTGTVELQANTNIDGDATATTFIGDLRGATVFQARATEDITKGEAVYISGLSGNTPEVALARANSASTMPAFGIAESDIANTATGNIVTFGSCPGHDVSDFGETSITFALGDTVYVSSAEAGKLTNVAPTGESNLIQNIGKIERASPTTNMTIKVGGAGRTNATPALDNGNIFIGNGSNQASTVSLATQIKSYTGLTVVGDDSSGTGFNIGETIKVAGATGITTAVSGDTLTITGPSLTSYITASSSDTLTNKTIDANGTGNSISNLEVADFAAASIVTAGEGIGSNNNDTTIPTSAAVKAYADSVGGGSTGDLTISGSTISSPSNAPLTLDPSGTGKVTAVGGLVVTGGDTETADISSSGNIDAVGFTATGSSTFDGVQITDNTITSATSNADLQINASGTGTIVLENLKIGTSGSTVTTILDEDNMSSDSDTALATQQSIKAYVDSEISGVSGASTGDITFTGSTIQSPSNADITLDPSGTGGVVAQGPVTFNAGYIEKINTLTSSSTITVNCALASIHTVTLGTSTEFNITNLPTGGSVTLIITQDGTGTRTATFGTDGSSAVKFPSNSSTLSTGGGDIDVVTIINDGTNFLGNIAKDYRSS